MFKGLFRRTKYLTVNTAINNDNTADKTKRNIQNAEKQGFQDDISLKEESSEQKPVIPNGMWIKCKSCGETVYKKELQEHFMVCKKCSTHFRLSASERLDITLDEGSFEEWDKDMKTANPLDYPGYEEKIKEQQDATNLAEACITGIGKINELDTVIGVMDSRFLMASMGFVVGEKLTRAIERATHKNLPVIIFTASGGARMQEGMFSLMQMAKVSAALAKHNEAGLLYITVLTDPTTGGVTASFAMLGDIILAEPGALIGFAGKRVIEQTIKQKLPEGFQSAEFLLEHGFVDKIVARKDMKKVLSNILKLHNVGASSTEDYCALQSATRGGTIDNCSVLRSTTGGADNA